MGKRGSALWEGGIFNEVPTFRRTRAWEMRNEEGEKRMRKSSSANGGVGEKGEPFRSIDPERIFPKGGWAAKK